MSRLLSLAGSPSLQALEARSYSAYDGCVSLDTSTASSIYNLDQSDPPTCAATCGDEYQYIAIQAQFCFCFPSPPDIVATFNDSDCSINCDFPYQDESCGGVTLGTLIDVYSYYVGSDWAYPPTPNNGGHHGSGTSSPVASKQASSPSEQPYTPLGPTTTEEPSPITPGPTASVTDENITPPGTPGTFGASPSGGHTEDPGVGITTAAASGPDFTCTDETATQTPSEASRSSSSDPGDPHIGSPGPTTTAVPQVVPTYTMTLWTTLTSYTTVYPGGPLQATILSLPTGTTCIIAELFTSSRSAVAVTTTQYDGSILTTVLPASVHVVAYNPYVSEVRELEVESGTTRSILAAVVPAETGAISR